MRMVLVVPFVASLGLAGALGACHSDEASRPNVSEPVDPLDVAPPDQLSAAARGQSSGPTPIADGAIFSPEITHPYLPLSAVRYTELQSDSERVVRAVADQTENVDGIECLVLVEREYDGGDLAEVSTNYFAQDSLGNVWYFGEKVDEYDDGQVVSHGGTWLAGRDVVEPCLFMPATPTVGLAFKPENVPPEAEEFDEIEQLDAALTLPAGQFHDVLVVKEGDRPGQWKERKYYARGVGLISENKTLNLVAAPAPGMGAP